MKRLLFILVFSFFFLSVSAQDFEILSVESLPADMSAREEVKTDHDDRQCALLRVATQNIAPEQREAFTFKPDFGSEIVERATRNGEIWLWVSPGLKYLRIMHRDWGQYELRLPDYVDRVEALHTYKVTLKGILTLAAQEPGGNAVTQQYLVFQLTPPNATLEVDEQLWSVDADGTAMKYVDFGTYNYRVRASDYFTETGNAVVNDPDNTTIVTVSLKPNFAEVTLTVDAEAEIWVNNEKKGVRTWKGQLGKGTYKIECKQNGHETTVVSREITPEMNGQSISLPKPKPVYGSLNVESSPNLATIYLDGKEAGKTPRSVNEILVGQHKLRLTKEGYQDYVATVEIVKGERKQLKAVMEESPKAPLTTTASQKNSAPTGAINGLFSVSSTKQVYFSQGNLQYIGNTNTWKFADHQWDVIGTSQGNNAQGTTRDLFGWGTSGYNHGANCYQPWSTSTSSESYYVYGSSSYNLYDQSGQADWGYNAVANGGNTENSGWRTPTHEEWVYLFNTRSTPSGIRYAHAKVNDVNGVILLPDNWNSSYYSLSKTNQSGAGFTSNTITASQWESLEQHGAVFLPAAGNRYGTSVCDVGFNGYYWSASYYYTLSAWYVYFYDSYLFTDSDGSRYYGQSVRLVRSAQ